MIIKKFKQLKKEDVSIAGGKGASLGEMYSSKIPVPNGFIVLSNAFQEFVEKTGLISEIEGELNNVNIESTETIETASENIQSMIFLKEFPEEFKEEIYSEFDSLDAKFVAVRSSATSEDSADAAWAGQLDTFLNTTKENLIENIKKCWASLFTPRAIFYRFEKGLDKTDVSVAVVIQKMVQSEISGIAFSVHPITEDRNQILIEAGYGLGEAIVSGSVTPDNYVINKKEMKIGSKNINRQNKALYKAKEGGIEWKDIEKGDEQKLSDELILKLSEIIIGIENHYDFPCDIEWAYKKGELYITQSRPITTLSESFEIEEKGGEENLAQKFINSLKGQEFNPSTDVDIFPETVVWIKRDFIKKNYDNKDILPQLFLMQGDESIEYSPEKKFVEVSKELFKKYIKDKKTLLKIGKRFQKDLENISKMYGKYTYKKINKSSLNQLQTIIPKILKGIEPKLFFMCDFETCKDYIKNLKLNNPKRLWDYARDIPIESFDKRKQRIFYKKFLQLKKEDLIEFCQYFYTGLKGGTNISEIKNKLIEEFEFDRKKAKIKLEELNGRFKEIQNKRKKKLSALTENEKKIVEYIIKLSELRDIRKDIHSKGITLLYRIAKLKILDKLKIPEEYLEYISYDELLKDLNYFKNNKDKILKRKEGYVLLVEDSGKTFSQYGNIKKSKDMLNAEVKSQNKLKDNQVRGNCAYSGKVKGKVRIIDNVKKQAKDFQEGEILVTSMTRPEFVPLMKKSIATITNEGGLTCHAAIISRELQIPCVIGTKNATQLLKNGDLVEVDADNGVVRILERM